MNISHPAYNLFIKANTWQCPPQTFFNGGWVRWRILLKAPPQPPPPLLLLSPPLLLVQQSRGCQKKRPKLWAGIRPWHGRTLWIISNCWNPLEVVIRPLNYCRRWKIVFIGKNHSSSVSGCDLPKFDPWGKEIVKFVDHMWVVGSDILIISASTHPAV